MNPNRATETSIGRCVQKKIDKSVGTLVADALDGFGTSVGDGVGNLVGDGVGTDISWRWSWYNCW